MATAFVLGLTPVRSSDVWIHLATGRSISETGDAPTKNVFSFAEAERRVISHSWLFQLAAFKLYGVGGLEGMVIVKALLGAVAAGLVFYTCRVRGAERVPATVLTGLVVLAMAPRLWLRPEIVSFVLLALILLLMESYRQVGTRWIWAAPVVLVLWGNLHGSSVAGALIPGGYLFARIVGRKADKEGGEASGSTTVLALVAVLCLVAPVLNPYGLETMLLPFSHFGTMSEGGFKEFFFDRRPMALSDFGGAHMPFAVLAALGVVGLIADRRRLPLTDLAWFLGFGGLAITSVRFASLFAIAAGPVVAIHLCRGMISAREWVHRLLPTEQHRGLVSVFLAGVFLAIGLLSPGAVMPGLRPEPGTYPVEELAFLDEHDISGPMLNDFEFGGYIIWKDFPRRRVFVDTRGPVAYDPDNYHLALEMIDTRNPERALKAWEEINTVHDFNCALVWREALTRRLNSSDAWALVFLGDAGAVFTKRNAANQSIIDRFEYEYVKPGLDRADVERLAVKASTAEDVESGDIEDALQRWVEDAPTRFRPKTLLAHWYERLGRIDRAIEAYERAARDHPEEAEAHGALARLYAEVAAESGDTRQWERAEAACRRAVESSSSPDEYRSLLKEIRLRRKARQKQ